MEEIHQKQEILLPDVIQMSNTGYDPDSEFIMGASAAAAQRRTSGYNADGLPGGPYGENNPPPGKVFRGYLKGNVGILWGNAVPCGGDVAAEAAESSERGDGNCVQSIQRGNGVAAVACPRIPTVEAPRGKTTTRSPL